MQRCMVQGFWCPNLLCNSASVFLSEHMVIKYIQVCKYIESRFGMQYICLGHFLLQIPYHTCYVGYFKSLSCSYSCCKPSQIYLGKNINYVLKVASFKALVSSPVIISLHVTTYVGREASHSSKSLLCCLYYSSN